MSKARVLANLISDNAELADGQISVAEVVGAAPLANPTFTGNIDAGDNVRIRLGDSDDLQIYHDEDDSYIADEGTGNLILKANGTKILMETAGGNTLAEFINNGNVVLYSNNAERLRTNGTGINVTGTVTADGLDLGDNSVLNVDTIALDKIKGDADDNTNITFAGSDHTRFYQGGDNVLTVSPNGIEVTAKTTSDALDLTAIAKDITDTAVDVFVYDTSKDSDGGAWRKRTQGTSWYNETLNTATRGSRKEFPAVAVIVAESNQVTIYDGDDPDMPMWMVFNAGGGSFSDHTYIADSSAVDSLGFINAQMVVGNSSGYGIFIIDFLKETSECLRVSDEAGLRGIHTNVGIANRNTNSGEHQGTLRQLASNSINDVAMTVLPNAPIDSATGLPVPTIAVATRGGYSIIKDDGTVVDGINTAASHLKVEKIQFTEDHMLLYGGFDYDSQNRSRFFRVDDILSSDTTITTDTDEAQNSAELYGYSANIAAEDKMLFVDTVNGADNSYLSDPHLAASGTELRFANLNGVYKVARNKTLPSAGLANKITSDYNTGWMNGDIKLATLSDTDDTNVTGAELVTNGTFDSNTSGWTAINATLSVDAGRLKIVDNGSSAAATQTISVTAGETYVISFNATAGNASCQAYVSDGTFTVIGSTIPNGVFSHTYTAPSGVSSFVLGLNNTNGITGQYCFFDSVSVRLAEEDRSVNGNGLQVFGTVTKNPVATSADLVAYSGFSGSNKLAQPYNSDLNWGSGDFSIMLWVNTSNNTTSSAEYYLARGYIAPSWTNHSWYLRQNVSTNYIEYAVTENGFSTRDIIQSPSAVALNTWTQICVVKRGSNHEMYFDGRLVQTASTTRSHTNADNAPFVIGDYGVGGAGAFLDGSIALVRLSATAPSPEQIKKIYEDEKVLFQENAKATLYGTSDAVTALAHDDTTDLLHVGTSAGRSVFQGLRRVDNTTTAVGAAISASNGLVAED